MLNPLTTILLDQMAQEETLVGLASSDDTVVTGLASSEEVTISVSYTHLTLPTKLEV